MGIKGDAAHWRDLVASSLEQAVVALRHEIRDLSQAEQIEAERHVARDIYLSIPDGSEQVDEWKRRTAKTRPTYYRRIRELRARGELAAK